MNQKLLALYGLKWNPFTPEVPIEALHVPPKVENFCWRIEQAHLREGGFALSVHDGSITWSPLLAGPSSSSTRPKR